MQIKLRRVVLLSLTALAFIGLTPIKGLAENRDRAIAGGTVTLRCDNDSSISTASWIIITGDYIRSYALTLRFADGTSKSFSAIYPPSDQVEVDLGEFSSSQIQGRVTLLGRIRHVSGAVDDLGKNPLRTFCTTQ